MATFTKNAPGNRDEELQRKQANVTAELAAMAKKAAEVQAALNKIDAELAKPPASIDVEAELAKLRKLGPEQEAHQRVLVWIEGQSEQLRRELVAVAKEQRALAVERKLEQIALAKQRIVAGVEAVLPFLQDLRDLESAVLTISGDPYALRVTAGEWAAPLEAFLVNAGSYTRVMGQDNQVHIERVKVP